MQDNAISQPSRNLLPAMIILILTAFLLLFTIVGFLASFSAEYDDPWAHYPGVSFLLLAGYIFVGISTLRVRNALRSLLLTRSIWTGLLLGAILGGISALPVMNQHFRILAFLLMAFVIAQAIWGMLTGHLGPFMSDPLIFWVVAALCLLCILVYGGIAWWMARRARSVIYGVGAALLSALFTPLVISTIYICSMSLPGLLDLHSGYFHQRLVSLAGPLVLGYAMIFSQAAVALIAGLIGALSGRFGSQAVQARPTK